MSSRGASLSAAMAACPGQVAFLSPCGGGGSWCSSTIAAASQPGSTSHGRGSAGHNHGCGHVKVNMGSCGCDALYRSGTLAGLTSALSTSSYGPSNGNAIDFDNNNDNNKNNYNYNDYTLDGNYTNDNNDNVAPK
jgi:hypothetical protein